MAEKSTIAATGSMQVEMIPGAFEMNMQFQDGQTRACLVIPIDGNPVIKRGKKDPHKLNLGLTVFKNDEPDRYQNTHYIRMSINQDAQNYLGDDQKKNITRICGNFKPVQRRDAAQPAQGAYPQAGNGAAPAAPGYGQAPYMAPQGQQGYQGAPQAPGNMPAGARPAPAFGPTNPATPYNDLPPGPGEYVTGRGIIGG